MNALAHGSQIDVLGDFAFERLDVDLGVVCEMMVGIEF